MAVSAPNPLAQTLPAGGLLTDEQVLPDRGRFAGLCRCLNWSAGKRVLLIVPDSTRTAALSDSCLPPSTILSARFDQEPEQPT